MIELRRTKFGAAICLASFTILLVGCSAQPVRDRFDEKVKYNQVSANEIVKKQSESATSRMENLIKSLEKTRAIIPEQVVAPVFDPLEELKVSLIVENGELQYIFKALADQAKMNLIIHPNLLGNSYKISVAFRDVSARTVFNQLTRMSDVYGRIEDNTMIINPMHEKLFQLGFMESNVSNSFSSGGNVLGGGSRGGGSSGGGSSGGNRIKGEFSVSGNNMPSSNPYNELQSMLNVLVGESVKGAQHSSVSSASNLDEIGVLSRLGTAIRNDLPLYSLNRMTGTLFVRAKPSVISTVTKIINNFELILGGQIVIDAQIVEVKLSDQFKLGIDWSSLRSNLATSFSTGQRALSSASTNFDDVVGQGARTFTIPTPTIGGNILPEFAAQYLGNSLALALDAMQSYGDVTVLSNPTIRTKHGQPAIISVGSSIAYISDTRVVTNSGAGSAVTSQEIQTAQLFDGLMIGVVPYIDSEGNISLSIHPVQSKVDPTSLALIDAGGDSRVTLPIVELKSMVTQVKVKSGDLIVMGGLIDQVDARDEAGVPGLSSIPLIGNLFKSRKNQNSVRELVLLLKVKLL